MIFPKYQQIKIQEILKPFRHGIEFCTEQITKIRMERNIEVFLIWKSDANLVANVYTLKAWIKSYIKDLINLERIKRQT